MLLQDFQVTTTIPQVWCDNLSSIILASNPVFHARTKHIEVDYHYVCKQVMARKIHVHHITSTDQLADIFTKSLSVSRHQTLTSKLMVQAAHHLEGGC